MKLEFDTEHQVLFNVLKTFCENKQNKTWSSVSNSSFVLDYKFWLVLVEGN